MRVIAETITPAANATRPGRVILVQRASAYQPYVTAWQGGEPGNWDQSWCWGHYFDSPSEAFADYESRCKRGY